MNVTLRPKLRGMKEFRVVEKKWVENIMILLTTDCLCVKGK